MLIYKEALSFSFAEGPWLQHDCFVERQETNTLLQENDMTMSVL